MKSAAEQDAFPKTESGLKTWGIETIALGISLGGAPHSERFTRMMDWVELAEQIDLHSVWLPEMHFAPGVNASPLTLLAAVARRTTRVRLGTTSLLLPIHHPLRIAHDVATLDHLSQGRVLLGLGRGFRAALFAAFGLDPSTKRNRFDQALDLMLDRWAGRTMELQGTPFEDAPLALREAPCQPFQRPHPPLAVAAFGRKGLEQAARRALPYLASPLEPFELIRENLQFHQEKMNESGRTATPVVPIMRTVFISDQPQTLTQAMNTLKSENPPPRPGTKLPLALSRAMAAPMEDRVVLGDVAEVTARLKVYQKELGMNLLVVRPEIGGVSLPELRESIMQLHREVLPALSDAGDR